MNESDPSEISRRGQVGLDGGQYIYLVKPRTPDMRESGVAIVSYSSLNAVRQESQELWAALREAGLQGEDMVAVIGAFLPNGANLDEEHSRAMRSGRGSFVLDHLIEDAKALGSKAVCILPTSNSARRFFGEKHHFRRLDVASSSEECSTEFQAFYWRRIG